MRPATQRTGTAYAVPGKMWTAGHHTGIDLLTPTGTPIVSPATSRVVHAGKNSGTGWGTAYGIHVIGQTTVNGVTYRWIAAHLKSTHLKPGDRVGIGQPIGVSDSTGNVTGPHLHFEVRCAGYAYGKDVNPSVLLNVVPSTDRMDPDAYFLGAVGEHVTWLGEQLVAHGYGGHYTTGPGPTFTATDRAAVRDFQLAQKWTGDGADGYPGPTTLKLLARTPATPPAQRAVEVVSAVQNMAGLNAHGIATAKARVARYVAARKATPVHVVNAQEADVLSTVRPRLDSGLKPLGYARAGGGKARYNYTRGVKVIAAGLLTVPSALWYRKDDKQASWVVFELDGIRGMDVSLHLESDNGTEADQLRVKQATWIAGAALDKASAYQVPAGHVMLTGDTNSDSLVVTTLGRLGWRNVAANTKYENAVTFMGWDGRSKHRYDYALVRGDAPEAVLESLAPNTAISDHAGLRVRRKLTTTA